MCDRLAFLKHGNLIALDKTEAIMAHYGGSNLEAAFTRAMYSSEEGVSHG